MSSGNHLPKPRGSASPRWTGGRYVTRGYVYVMGPGHPNADARGRVAEHVAVAVRARGGRALPLGAEIHHVNGVRGENRVGNLVVCQDRAYHFLLERRSKALAACGHAHWRHCKRCHQWDDPSNLIVCGRSVEHRACKNDYQRARYQKKGTR